MKRLSSSATRWKSALQNVWNENTFLFDAIAKSVPIVREWHMCRLRAESCANNLATKPIGYTCINSVSCGEPLTLRIKITILCQTKSWITTVLVRIWQKIVISLCSLIHFFYFWVLDVSLLFQKLRKSSAKKLKVVNMSRPKCKNNTWKAQTRTSPITL